MKHRIKNTLRGMSKHLGIKVKFVDYFGDDVHGKLLPREKRILINARKPRNEHIYTLLHEIGHYLIHFKSLPRKHHPRFFDINWKMEWLANLCSKIRRYFRFVFNKESGKEWEADIWAMCAFIYFAKRIGCRDELCVFLDRHPEKSKYFFWPHLASPTATLKRGLKRLVIRLLCRFKHFGNLQCRDQTWQPPFHVNLASVPLVCSFRRAEITPVPKPDFQPTGLTP